MDRDRSFEVVWDTREPRAARILSAAVVLLITLALVL